MTDTFAAETPAKPETEMQTVECLYVGRRVLANGKLAEGYVTLNEAKDISADNWDLFERAVSLFEAGKRSKSKALSRAVVGGVYKMEIKLTEGRITTARTGSREFVRRYEDREVVVACEVKDDAARMHQRSAQLMAKISSGSVLADELRALRALYKRTPYADRLALELLVLDALRREPR